MAERSSSLSTAAFVLLRIAFVIVPILAGLDKFFHVLTDWDQFAPTWLISTQNAAMLMRVCGVIEIIVGLGILWKPRIFAYILAAWFVLIIIDLIMLGRGYDDALRDFGLLMSSLALAMLSHKYRH
jgi:uncharacterized membrane protein YphA (DoxX/SURF4 family)